MENNKLPQSYYDDRDAIHKRIREVDEKHTNNYNNLNVVLAGFKPTLTQLVDATKEMSSEQKKTNEHILNQDKRLAEVEKDTKTFKQHLIEEQEEAKAKGKENKDFILKALGVFVGGGGIAWLIHPLFDLIKTILN
ncbi:hypothetical protein [Staphylococcus xylosus]